MRELLQIFKDGITGDIGDLLVALGVIAMIACGVVIFYEAAIAALP